MSWYSKVMGQAPMIQPAQQPQMPMMQFQNPLQRMNAMMQAMRNPAAFVKQNIPDIPDNILNDPNQVLNYMQSRFGISNQQIQQLQQQNPYPGRF